ncbi:MAG TPA: hypothetical protein VFA21_15370 [Pyrinomonadaceae bacterium]|nr:hypothetical protein [Pyrinomonadaceae bacterium]
MKRIKLLSVALLIAVAGALHAAARVQGAGVGRASGDKPACCKAHKASDKQAAGDSCDMAGGDCCCKSHSATKQAAKASDEGGCSCCDSGCCAHDKKGAQAGTMNASGAQAMSCDASGDCCQTCDCCGAHKSHAAHESAGGGKGDGASCCAGCSCCGARQAARR